MTYTPQSIAARYRQPASPTKWRAFPVVACILLLAGTAGAQSPMRLLSADADIAKEAAGTTLLATVLKGTQLSVGAAQGPRTEVTLEGWLPKSALRDDSRDGFDVSVALAVGAAIKRNAGSGSTLATVKVGTLFKRVSTQGDWVMVRRTGWILSDRLSAPAPTPATATQGSTAPPATTTADVLLNSSSAFSAIKSGSPVGTVDAPLAAKVVDRADGWVKVQLEVWVRESSLGGAASSGLTAADLRADPDKYTGREVQWTLQVLAVQKADELRPELPLNQPYVLTRGPLPESGFVYLVIPAAEIDHFKALEALAKITIVGTVRAGRSRHLPTPVIDFVSRIK